MMNQRRMFESDKKYSELCALGDELKRTQHTQSDYHTFQDRSALRYYER